MPAQLCANESALLIHLRTVDQEERHLNAVENQAARLLLADYSDSRTDMVLEALHEISDPVADGIAIHMGHISNKHCVVDKARHYEYIGRLVAGSITNYCAAEARKQAERDIDNSCQRCFGSGCRHCFEAA
jgi:hypothetical protein